jgi:thiosulfate/3-mercaptopyruvate sulfurtransferase
VESPEGHIPCAVHTDYAKDGWRVKAGEVPGMLPGAEKLETLIGGLGIDNDTQVVIAALGGNATSTGSATRLYWTFKVLGHDKVALLDGGTQGYAKDKSRPMATGVVTSKAKTFKADPRPEILADRALVEQAAAQGLALVDYRRADEYLGINRNDKTAKAGTVPGARNLPIEWLTRDNTGSFRSPETLRQLMGVAQVDPQAPQVAFCNTGHLASLGWFVSSEILGNPEVRLYDGSMADWSRAPDLPMERKVITSE